MEFKFDDGGRELAGYKGKAGDCATRAIAIATGKSYQEVYDALNEVAQSEHLGKRKRGASNARTGVYKQTICKYLEGLGWKWTPTMFIGQGCKVHLRPEELPKGRVICNVSKHTVAVVDGVLHDTYDSSRQSTRCVYGYFTKEGC